MELQDVLAVVALTMAVVSIITSVVAIWVSLHNNKETVKALSKITHKADAIERDVSGTQKQLLDTVTEIANPRSKTSPEELNIRLVREVGGPEMLKELLRASMETKDS